MAHSHFTKKASFFKSFLFTGLCFLVCAFGIALGINYLVMSEYESWKAKVFAQGYEEGKKANPTITETRQLTKQEKEDTALLWWTGSTNLDQVRKRLCK